MQEKKREKKTKQTETEMKLKFFTKSRQPYYTWPDQA